MGNEAQLLTTIRPSPNRLLLVVAGHDPQTYPAQVLSPQSAGESPLQPVPSTLRQKYKVTVPDPPFIHNKKLPRDQMRNITDEHAL